MQMGTDRFNVLDKKSYQTMCNTIKAGDILFCKGEFGISKAIVNVQKNYYATIVCV